MSSDITVVIVLKGAAAIGLVVGALQNAATPPGADVLQYGATGVLVLAFLWMLWALVNNRIVSRQSANTEERERRLLELIEGWQEREDRLTALIASLIEK